MKQVLRHVLCVLVAMSASGVVGCDGGEGGPIYNVAGDLARHGQVHLALVQGTLRPGSGPWSFSRVWAWDAKGHAIGCMIESFDDSKNGPGISLMIPYAPAVDWIRLDATLLHEGKEHRVEAEWKADGPSRLGWQRTSWQVDGESGH
jgi:hypothetical protein